MITIVGTHNRAHCFTDALDDTARAQIQTLCDRPEFAEATIRIMPDVHAGMGCTIGTTLTVSDKVVPGMVGVDIGCGMETVQLGAREIDFAALDALIHRDIPCGYSIRSFCHPFEADIDLTALRCAHAVNITRARHSIGTLGGGNHFIEAARNESGALYIIVHSGSRNIGSQVAEYYQAKARHAQPHMPKDLAFAAGALFDDYIHDMKIIQHYADLNRRAMLAVILHGMGWEETDRFTTVHNYIDTDAMILRKGAVSAKAGERLLIPINMRDGSVICIGKGNDEWNQSAPHGAGRLFSRSAAFKQLSMEEFAAQMQGIYTSSVNKNTLDESPMAYKPMGEILKHLTPTADIVERLTPVYNFKASESGRRS